MEKVKMKLLVGMSGVDASYSPGDEAELSISEAVKLEAAGSAEPVNKKVYASAKAAYEKEAQERKQIEEQNKARLEREAYELELNSLYERVVELESAIAGATIDDIQKAELVASLRDRDSKIGETK